MLALTPGWAEEAPVPEPAALIVEGWRRIDRRDYEGARIVANQALEGGLQPRADALAVLGAAFELEGHPERAIPLYERALREVPEGSFADHMRFRLAEAYGTLGEVDQALVRVEALEGRWTPTDQLKVVFVRGVLLVEAGHSREGVRALERTLNRSDSDEVTFYQAKAHAAIARALTEGAAKLALDGSQSRQVRHLKRRTALVDEAEQHVLAAIELKEPEWVLDGMYSLGLGFEQIGDALSTLPVPASIASDPKLLAEYQAMMGQEIEKMYLKAERHYSEGAGVGYRLQWQGKRLERLEAADKAVQAKIEALDTAS
jgi:tetratricopeptide (TPR) repeat protein